MNESVKALTRAMDLVDEASKLLECRRLKPGFDTEHIGKARAALATAQHHLHHGLIPITTGPAPETETPVKGETEPPVK